MDKLKKTVFKLAESEGLKVLGVTQGKKHRYVVVANDLGWTMEQTLHNGNKFNNISLNNLRADLHRFAKGNEHNLRNVTK
jgi:hypothetical protein